jgi:hypothetical protein
MPAKRSLAAAAAGIGLVLLAAGLLASPAWAKAKTKAGAAIEVVGRDGSEKAGELIAVRPGSIVVADPASNVYDFIPLEEIRILRIPKVSRAAGAWSGFQQGAFFGAILGDLSRGSELSTRKRRTWAVYGGLAGGAAGSLVGYLKGKTTKKKEVIQIKDQPPDELAAILSRLNGLARVREALS